MKEDLENSRRVDGLIGRYHEPEISRGNVIKHESSGVLYVRSAPAENGLRHAAAYADAAPIDGETRLLPAGESPPEGWTWRTAPSARGIIRVDYESPGERAPDLWFVNVDEPNASPPATNLVAFATDHFEPGTVISRYAFATLGVDNNLQVGAVRWYRNGIVHQVFVAPDWRRRFVATSILIVADAFHHVNDWPGVLRSDGRRTDLGKLFAAGLRFPQRFAPLEKTMPPMDPAPSASPDAALD